MVNPVTWNRCWTATICARRERFSLPDSTFIDQVAAKTFGIEKEAVRPPGFRPWVSEKLEVVVTVSNTRGIPYSIQFAGEGLLEKHHHDQLQAPAEVHHR